jgi:DNA repair protein SbcD/Mre11
MRLLCTADLHIGRRPTRLPPGIDGPPISTANAWHAVVELAVSEQVDAVLIAGDVVDRDNRYFEGRAALEQGLRRLGEAGIRVVAVAGNHDFDVLPELARSLPDTFTLLGTGGTWEAVTLHTEDTQLRIVGWSFPHQWVQTNPLASYPVLPGHGLRTIGLLHTEIGVPSSTYAPCTAAELAAAGPEFWLVGHIHLSHEPAASVLYPGSPIAMHPRERGLHGAWMVVITDDAPIAKRRIPLSPVRYDSINIDLSGCDDPTAIRDAVVTGIESEVERWMTEQPCLRAAIVRVEVGGRTPVHRHVAEALAELKADYDGALGGVTVRVDQLVAATHEAIDLDALSAEKSAKGLLARILLAGQHEVPSTELDSLVEAASRAANGVTNAPVWRLAGLPALDCNVRELALAQAHALLDALHMQEPT